MNRLLAFALFLVTLTTTISTTAQTLAKRVVPNDPAKYRALTAVHAGAGKMGFTQLIGRTELNTNFLYLHTGVIEAKSGIGHHFHHNIEEMFVLLSGEAQFTINGRTSTIKAPAMVPCKMGNSHGIYNATDQPVKWMNFAVSAVKGKSDNFDLGDTRVGAALDVIPTFVSGRLDKAMLRPNNAAYPGTGVLYRRVLGPDVFTTNWNHVDNVVVPKGVTAGPHALDGFEEVYYVVKGSGTITKDGETVAIKADDAFYGLLGEKLSIANNGADDLELLVIGIAKSKPVPGGQPVSGAPQAARQMTLQMDFVVTPENAAAFERMYTTIYVPALKAQAGYIASKLIKIFPETVAKSISAEGTAFNYQMQLYFDTEANRQKWVASKEHDIAWPAATALAKEFKWRGYDLAAEDSQR
jgi:mannose-6-phosphate isomerase-like protein (cupin superfamily)